MKPSIVFFGSPVFAVPILAALHEQFDVKLVVTQSAKAGKRHVVEPTAVAKWAAEHGLNVLTPASLKDVEFRSAIESLEVTLGIVAAYGKILPQWLLDWPDKGMINVHGSILPAYRGASPIAAAILVGETSTGITFIQMNAKMDEGDILATYPTPIDATDTTESLALKLSQLAANHSVEVVGSLLSGDISSQPQPESASYTSLLIKRDGQIDFNAPPADLERRIRAYWPWPGVWGEWQGKQIKLLPEGHIQMEGKKVTLLSDFLRGYPDFPIKII